MIRHTGEGRCPENPLSITSTDPWMPAYTGMTKIIIQMRFLQPAAFLNMNRETVADSSFFRTPFEYCACWPMNYDCIHSTSLNPASDKGICLCLISYRHLNWVYFSINQNSHTALRLQDYHRIPTQPLVLHVILERDCAAYLENAIPKPSHAGKTLSSD